MRVYYHNGSGSHDKNYNVFYDPGSRQLLRLPRLSKRNGYWRQCLAKRYTLQVQEEEITAWDLVSSLGFDLYLRDIKATGGRYRGFEQQDGVTVTLSHLGRRQLPDGFEAQVGLVDHWLAWMPVGTRVKGPRDFGGKYAGSRPRGSSDYVWLNVELEEAKRVMTADQVEWKSVDEDHVRILVTPGDVEGYVRARFRN